MATHGDQSRPTVKPRLNVQSIEWMFAHVLRLREVADLAFPNLRPELFLAGTEAHYNLLWRAAQTIFKKEGPTAFDNPDYAYAVLELELLSRVQARPNVLSQELYERLLSCSESKPGLLKWIFNIVKETELKATWGKELLRDFRLEREVSDVLRQAVTEADGKTIINLPEIVTNISNMQVAIEAQATDRAVSGAPEGWTPKPLKKFPCGISFLDNFLEGGHAGGEVYGVLGAYGSGKTMLAMQLTHKGSLWQQGQAVANPEYHPKDWFLFTYEATSDECIVRLWSMAATIDHHKIEEFTWDKLTTAVNGVDNLEHYERKFFHEDHARGKILGEKERLEEVMKSFNVNLWIHDMTGSHANPKKGTGYVDEIVSLVQQEIHALSRRDGWQHEVGGVVIDYAGLCAKRHMSDKGIDLNHMRHYIGDFGYKCKTKLAVPFNCPVWVFHQLDTKSNKRTMKVSSHHADAAEAKNFAENMVFCFQLRSKDIDTDTLYMDCSKARRGRVGKSPLLQIQGLFYRIIEDTEHTVNTVGEIKSKKGLTVTSAEPDHAVPSEPPKPFNPNEGLDDIVA